jgi:hypothetical protein
LRYGDTDRFRHGVRNRVRNRNWYWFLDCNSNWSIDRYRDRLRDADGIGTWDRYRDGVRYWNRDIPLDRDWVGLRHWNGNLSRHCENVATAVTDASSVKSSAA